MKYTEWPKPIKRSLISVSDLKINSLKL